MSCRSRSRWVLVGPRVRSPFSALVLLSVVAIAVAPWFRVTRAVAAVRGSSPTPSAAVGDAPLDTSLVANGASWVVLAMGYLDQPTNTFWQAFYRPKGSSRWILRTPPGVATNGGLVATVAGGLGVLAFVPSQQLRYAPLATTTDGGAQYGAGLLPDDLASSPDALSVTAAGMAAAITPTDVLSSPANLTGWHPIATTKALAATLPGRTCGLLSVTAVALVGQTVDLGADCGRPGDVGILASSGGAFRAIGPSLPATMRQDRVDVVRLVRDGTEISALLALTGGPTVEYVAAWLPRESATWQLSPAMTLRGSLRSASVASGDGFALLTSGTSGPQVAVIRPGASTWQMLPAPPIASATVAVDRSRIDVIAVNQARFIDYSLVGGRWSRSQVINVPILYGSSN